MPCAPSRFLECVPLDVVDERRSSGVFGGDLYRKSAPRYSAAGNAFTAAPATATASTVDVESQDAPRYIKGERVRHRTFGAGAIRGLSGTGRDLKVVVEFDDEEIGTKHLLVAYAGLERDWDPA
jgi:DNA helicase-2/ATP-dependent DNA helicase PcrA